MAPTAARTAAVDATEVHVKTSGNSTDGSTVMAIVIVCMFSVLLAAGIAYCLWRYRKRHRAAAANGTSDRRDLEGGALPRRIRKKNKHAGRPAYLSSSGDANDTTGRTTLGSDATDRSTQQSTTVPAHETNSSMRSGWASGRNMLAAAGQRLRNTMLFSSGLFVSGGAVPTADGRNNPSMLRNTNIDAFCRDSVALTALLDDPLLLNKRIAYDELTFLRSLSKGAFGEVWLAQLETRHVAIKCLLPEKRIFKHAIEQFAAEIQLLATLEHPNIVAFVGVSWSPETMEDLCAIVEFMDAGDLDSVLTKHKNTLSWTKEKLSIAMDIVEGLVYLHTLRPVVVHRDLKAKNVLLNQAWDAKISDFGVSRKTELNETLTSGVGTLLWTAPEIIEGKKYNEQADIYSFGVVLSEIDTCAPPFAHIVDADTGERVPPMQIAQGVRLGKLRVDVRDDCPLAIRELIRACTQLEPDARPTSMHVAFTLKSIIAPTLQRTISIDL